MGMHYYIRFFHHKSPCSPDRRDKYESDLREYWVDTETTGTMEAEHSETLIDQTAIEGEASGFELGVQSSVALAETNQEEEETDHELDDEDDGSSVRSKPKPEKLFALEAWSIDPVKVQSIHPKKLKEPMHRSNYSCAWSPGGRQRWNRDVQPAQGAGQMRGFV